MARLGNARHEAFAQLISKGTAQAEAYSEVGYKSTYPASHASHLAKRPDVAERIAQLRGENAPNSFEGGSTLAELGITYVWLVSKYNEIMAHAIAFGDLKVAKQCIAAIELLRQKEAKRAAVDINNKSEKIDINAMFGAMNRLKNSAAKPD